MATADLVIVSEIYAAREKPVPGVSGKQVANAARAAGARTMFEPVREKLGRSVLDVLEPGDVVLTLGAGDITKVGRELAEWLRAG